ncbi:MAG TPA: FAD-dependent monooxygenase [Rhizomicrobium sp.]|jgi:2-octaprenyl-6-methoxyphenol hydroxylase|nr:FAD-dependent monooxygenase [Rhizomicrobium sp.]
MARDDPQVVIAGAGMVGLTLSLALAQGGFGVLLVDPLPPSKTLAVEFDGRVSAISYSSARMLEVLGVWKKLKGDAEPIRDILVTDAKIGHSPSPFSLHFDHREIGEPLGYIAENRHIRAALLERAAAAETLEIANPDRVGGFAPASSSVTVQLESGRTVSAHVLVAADGRESASREQVGIGVISWSYPQRGIVATVEHERPHNGVAYEHFLPSGPFAILPMTGNRSSLVWTEREEIAGSLLTLPQPDFEDEIARRFGAHLGSIRVHGPRWSYPLSFHLAREYVRSRFALIGDAAHGIHPIAGQGLNLGFKDVAALAEVLLDAARLGLDFGTPDVLRRYERWRRFDSFALAAATDGLNRLFSNDFPPLRLVRDLGLGIVDGIGPLRRFFMRHAGGAVGELPRLLRGEAA